MLFIPGAGYVQDVGGFIPGVGYVQWDSSSAITLTIDNIVNPSLLSNNVLVQNNTLITTGINNTSILTTLVLTQQNLLSNLSAIVNTLALEHPSLISANILSANNINISTLVSLINLLQANLLELNKVQHTLLFSNINIVQNNSLSLDKTSNTLNISIPTLDTTLALLINNTLTTVTFSQTNLVSENSLQITKLLHTCNLGELLLETAYTLSINGITQEETLATISLFTTDVLETVNLNIANSFPNVDLTHFHLLIISDIVHSAIHKNIYLNISRIIVEDRIIYVLESKSGIPIYILR